MKVGSNTTLEGTFIDFEVHARFFLTFYSNVRGLLKRDIDSLDELSHDRFYPVVPEHYY